MIHPGSSKVGGSSIEAAVAWPLQMGVKVCRDMRQAMRCGRLFAHSSAQTLLEWCRAGDLSSADGPWGGLLHERMEKGARQELTGWERNDGWERDGEE